MEPLQVEKGAEMIWATLLRHCQLGKARLAKCAHLRASSLNRGSKAPFDKVLGWVAYCCIFIISFGMQMFPDCFYRLWGWAVDVKVAFLYSTNK